MAGHRHAIDGLDHRRPPARAQGRAHLPCQLLVAQGRVAGALVPVGALGEQRARGFVRHPPPEVTTLGNGEQLTELPLERCRDRSRIAACQAHRRKHRHLTLRSSFQRLWQRGEKLLRLGGGERELSLYRRLTRRQPGDCAARCAELPRFEQHSQALPDVSRGEPAGADRRFRDSHTALGKRLRLEPELAQFVERARVTFRKPRGKSVAADISILARGGGRSTSKLCQSRRCPAP